MKNGCIEAYRADLEEAVTKFGLLGMTELKEEIDTTQLITMMEMNEDKLSAYERDLYLLRLLVFVSGQRT